MVLIVLIESEFLELTLNGFNRILCSVNCDRKSADFIHIGMICENIDVSNSRQLIIIFDSEVILMKNVISHKYLYPHTGINYYQLFFVTETWLLYKMYNMCNGT